MICFMYDEWLIMIWIDSTSGNNELLKCLRATDAVLLMTVYLSPETKMRHAVHRCDMRYR